MVQWADDWGDPTTTTTSSSPVEFHNSTANSNNKGMSITATILNLTGIIVDTKHVTAQTITKADFCAVTAQITFLARQNDYSNTSKQNWQSLKSCVSHPLQQYSGSGKNVHQAQWFGKNKQAVVTLVDTCNDTDSLREFNHHTLFTNNKQQQQQMMMSSSANYLSSSEDKDNSLPSLAQSSYSAGSSPSPNKGKQMTSNGMNHHHHHHHRQKNDLEYEVMITLVRGNEELLVGATHLLITSEQLKQGRRATQQYGSSCTMDVALPVKTSNQQVASASLPSTTASKSSSLSFNPLKRVKSMGRRKLSSSTHHQQGISDANLFSFPNGDGRQYGILADAKSSKSISKSNGGESSSNHNDNCGRATMLHLRLDIWCNGEDDDEGDEPVVVGANDEVFDVHGTIDKATAGRGGKRVDLDVFEIPDSSNGNDHSARVVSGDAFFNVDLDDPGAAAAAQQTEDGGEFDQLPWAEMKEMEQKLHLQNLRELSQSMTHDKNLNHPSKSGEKGNYALGDVASLSTYGTTARNNKKNSVWSNLVEIMINITPCISSDNACVAAALVCNDDDPNNRSDFKMGAHKMRQRMRKVQLPVNANCAVAGVPVDMTMPQDEEEMRRRFQNMGLECGVNVAPDDDFDGGLNANANANGIGGPSYRTNYNQQKPYEYEHMYGNACNANANQHDDNKWETLDEDTIDDEQGTHIHREIHVPAAAARRQPISTDSCSGTMTTPSSTSERPQRLTLRSSNNARTRSGGLQHPPPASYPVINTDSFANASCSDVFQNLSEAGISDIFQGMENDISGIYDDGDEWSSDGEEDVFAGV